MSIFKLNHLFVLLLVNPHLLLGQILQGDPQSDCTNPNLQVVYTACAAHDFTKCCGVLATCCAGSCCPIETGSCLNVGTPNELCCSLTDSTFCGYGTGTTEPFAVQSVTCIGSLFESYLCPPGAQCDTSSDGCIGGSSNGGGSNGGGSVSSSSSTSTSTITPSSTTPDTFSPSETSISTPGTSSSNSGILAGSDDPTTTTTTTTFSSQTKTTPTTSSISTPNTSSRSLNIPAVSDSSTITTPNSQSGTTSITRPTSPHRSIITPIITPIIASISNTDQFTTITISPQSTLSRSGSESQHGLGSGFWLSTLAIVQFILGFL